MFKLFHTACAPCLYMCEHCHACLCVCVCVCVYLCVCVCVIQMLEFERVNANKSNMDLLIGRLSGDDWTKHKVDIHTGTHTHTHTHTHAQHFMYACTATALRPRALNRQTSADCACNVTHRCPGV